MPATGPRAPARTLVAVRAIVPVAQMPPNRPEAMLATPCATSSQFERWRRPVMPSATTAESSNSIEPSSANATASGSTAWTFARLISGSDGHGSVRGSSPKRLPMVSTGRLNSHAASDVGDHRDQASPASAGEIFASSRMIAIVAAATATAVGLIVSMRPQSACSFGTNAPGSRSGQGQAEQIPDLAGDDDDGDTGGEADRDRKRDELDVGAEPQQAGDHHQDAGEDRRQKQAVHAVPLHGRGNQHDEGAGRSADLEAAAAERRDQEAGDDRGVEALYRRRARRDRDRHRQRQRDDRDREAGEGVGLEIGKAVAFAQDRHQLRREQVAKARRECR